MIRDNRRVDPTTGAVRDQAAERPRTGAGRTRAIRAGGHRPVPGGRPACGADPANPNDAAQPLSLDLSAAELDLARQEAAERTADLQRITAEYANYRRRVDRDREAQVGGGEVERGARAVAGSGRPGPGARARRPDRVVQARSPTS